MLEKELETAITLARAASEKILEFYALEIIAEEKLGADSFLEPVTIADRTASTMIVEGLARSFPDDGILSEEEADDDVTRVSKKRAWIIDPLDGTKGFINKDGDFAVQIGLAEDGEAILGVVLLPFHDILYFAARGQGAYSIENGSDPQPLEVSNKTNFEDMSLAMSRNHASPRMREVIEAFGLRRAEQHGSVGLKVGLIVHQICDMYIHLSPRTKFWDTCAPQVILEEAGGKLTDLFGERITYNLADVQNHNGILATNGAAHEKAVEKLGAVLRKFGRPQFGVKK
jgi:3'(2'), 5'-bisphosphate nucleotidase